MCILKLSMSASVSTSNHIHLFQFPAWSIMLADHFLKELDKSSHCLQPASLREVGGFNTLFIVHLFNTSYKACMTHVTNSDILLNNVQRWYNNFRNLPTHWVTNLPLESPWKSVPTQPYKIPLYHWIANLTTWLCEYICGKKINDFLMDVSQCLISWEVSSEHVHVHYKRLPCSCLLQ